MCAARQFVSIYKRTFRNIGSDGVAPTNDDDLEKFLHACISIYIRKHVMLGVQPSFVCSSVYCAHRWLTCAVCQATLITFLHHLVQIVYVSRHQSFDAKISHDTKSKFQFPNCFRRNLHAMTEPTKNRLPTAKPLRLVWRRDCACDF